MRRGLPSRGWPGIRGLALLLQQISFEPGELRSSGPARWQSAVHREEASRARGPTPCVGALRVRYDRLELPTSHATPDRRGTVHSRTILDAGGTAPTPPPQTGVLPQTTFESTATHQNGGAA